MSDTPSSEDGERPATWHFAPGDLEDRSVYKIMAGCIVPRPIGFVTTLAKDGIRNAAPFSFFNMLCHVPPLVSLSIARDQRKKDTLVNIEETGEFVVNIVSGAIAAAQDRCAEALPSEVDEIAVSGLTAADSIIVKPPRISASPASFECQAVQIMPLPESSHTLVIGRIVMMHISGGILLPGHRIDHKALDAIGRMTGNSYCRTADTFTLAHDTLAVIAALPERR